MGGLALNPKRDQGGRRFITHWVSVTFGGYLLGFALTMLGLIAGDLFGLPTVFQSVIGLGMGAGVGFAQRRLAKQALGAAKHWVWTTAVGLWAGFLVFDIIEVAGGELPNRHSLQYDIVLGGLFVGLLQRRVLSSYSDRANWWVLACILGWSLAGRAANVTFTGQWDAILNLGMILMGGVILGIVTGGALIWLKRGETMV